MSLLIHEFMEKSAQEHPDMDAIRWLVKKDIHAITYRELNTNLTNVRRAQLITNMQRNPSSLRRTGSTDASKDIRRLILSMATTKPFSLLFRDVPTATFASKLRRMWQARTWTATPSVDWL